MIGNGPGFKAVEGREKLPSPSMDPARGRALFAISPHRTLAVSVTGGDCQLDCAHCGGHYLESMVTLAQAEDRPAFSYLISGGSDPEGRVPIRAYLDQIRALKNRGAINLHSGVVLDPAVAQQLGEVADTVSFDFVGSRETIEAILGLPYEPQDYLTSYRLLSRHSAVYPHICIGLHGGEIRGEYRAAELLMGESPLALVFLVFIPTRGSRLEAASPPPVPKVADLLRWVRRQAPALPLILGCMRPAGKYRRELDLEAVRAGVDVIVKPHPQALTLARQMGRPIRQSQECCSLVMNRIATGQLETGEGL